MHVKRDMINGVKFLVIDYGRVDYAYNSERECWVSCNGDYVFPKELAPSTIGIRWELNKEEIESIPIEDVEWIMNEESR
jgi:hypothetical protein